ncbi:MAG: sensor histidine kinase [Pleurocapsa sp.]
MQNWLLQSLGNILDRESELELNSTEVEAVANQQSESAYHSNGASWPTLGEAGVVRQEYKLAALKAQKEWHGAIAAVEKLLLSTIDLENDSSIKQGLIFSAPVPILSNITLISQLQTGIFTPEAFNCMALMPCSSSEDRLDTLLADTNPIIKLPLLPKDPIASEQFCLVLTASFALLIVLGEDVNGIPKFQFSFQPETIETAWATLRSRLALTKYSRIEQLDSLIEQFVPPVPDYRLVTTFSRHILQYLPDLNSLTLEKTRQIETIPIPCDLISSVNAATTNGHSEMELLQALTHEVRTPLTTIRTLTKLLLKRKQDFKDNVVKRLQEIDRECTEQIERMDLIFQAAELESTPQTAQSVHLVPFPLEQVFQANIPRWQQKAKRRNVELDFTLPQKLPKIISDPVMLDKLLTGLIESCTRSLPTGGHIHVRVSTAGDRLKLQVLSEQNNSDSENPFKSLGQLLSFQPATGFLSLNLDVTKNIFQALGGKLTVRQRQEQGKELTIFLPLGSKQQYSQKLNDLTVDF